MRVLIACEFSATVRDAFAARGHDAWSCDLLPSERGGKHYQCPCEDVIPNGWDAIVLHPPCTAICLSGNSTYGRNMPKNSVRLASLKWTADLWTLAKKHSPKVALENPKNVLGAVIGKRTQVIHPYQFGHPERKETWLWLHGLIPLVPTDDVQGEMIAKPANKQNPLHYLPPSKTRWKERSRTFPGIAKAMAEQWGKQ